MLLTDRLQEFHVKVQAWGRRSEHKQMFIDIDQDYDVRTVAHIVMEAPPGCAQVLGVVEVDEGITVIIDSISSEVEITIPMTADDFFTNLRACEDELTERQYEIT